MKTSYASKFVDERCRVLTKMVPGRWTATPGSVRGSTTLDRLLEWGLIVRTKPSNFKTRHLYCLTPAGEKVRALLLHVRGNGNV